MAASVLWPVILLATGHDDDLRARADMRSKLVPATHGLELRGGGGARAVDLVDRRVYALRDLFRLAARGLRYLARRHITAALPHPRAFQRVRQVDRVVPPIPFGFDSGVDLGGNNQQAFGEFGHCALLANYAALKFQKRSNARTAGVYHEAETRC